MTSLAQVLANAKCNSVDYHGTVNGTVISEVIVSRDVDSGNKILVSQTNGETFFLDAETELKCVTPVVEDKKRLPKIGDKVVIGAVFSEGKLLNNVVGTVIGDTKFAFEDIKIVVTDCTVPNDNSVYYRVAVACSSRICK